MADKRLLLLFILSILLITPILLSTVIASPMTPVGRGAISGIVTCESDSTVLMDATIYIPDLEQGAVTSHDGTYYIEDLPSGTYRVQYSFVGYVSDSRLVTVQPNTVTQVDVQLRIGIFESEAVTITGTPHASDPMQVPQDIVGLGGKTLQRVQTTSLGQTLEELPGMYTVSTGADVGKPVIRGLSGNRIRVLYDQVAMDHQQYGVRHQPNVDPLNAERIEVVRGPASILYGSDALGGVVNIIPENAPCAMDGGHLFSGTAATHYFSNNHLIVGHTTLRGAHENWGFIGNITRRSAGNYHAPDVPTYSETGTTGDPKFSGEIPHTDFDELTGTLGLGYHSNRGRFDLHYSRWGHENNFLLPSGDAIGLNLKNNIIRTSGTVVTAFGLVKPLFNYQRNLRLAAPGGFGRDQLSEHIDVDIVRDNYTWRLDIQHKPTTVWSGTAGAELVYQNQDTRGPTPLSPSADVWNAAGYFFEEARVKRWTILAGGRIDARSITAKADSRLMLPDLSQGETSKILEKNFAAITGAVGASFRFSDYVTVASNIGRGFRSPDIFELHAFGPHGGVAAFQIGTPGLNPETSLNTDLSLRWKSPYWQGAITGFVNQIDNYIYLARDPDYTVPNNTLPVYIHGQTDATLRGLECKTRLRPVRWMECFADYAFVVGDNDATDEALPLMPPTRIGGGIQLSHHATGYLSHPYFRFTLRHTRDKEAAGVYEPFSQFDTIAFGVASTSAYTLLNLEAGFDLRFDTNLLTVIGGIRNLTNKTYRDFLDTYKGYALNPGRNYSLRVALSFDSRW
jgi:outer membrane receptor protein involved in Fe transport